VRSKSHKSNSPRARRPAKPDAPQPQPGPRIPASPFNLQKTLQEERNILGRGSPVSSPMVDNKPLLVDSTNTAKSVKQALELKLISEIKEISEGRGGPSASSPVFPKPKIDIPKVYNL